MLGHVVLRACPRVHFSGVVTTKANVFTNAQISGDITMNRGLQSVANGGDCRDTSRLTNLGVTAITMRLT